MNFRSIPSAPLKLEKGDIQEVGQPVLDNKRFVMKIEITDIRILENPKSTLAFVDVRIDGIEIKDFRIMTNGRTPYVRTPFSTYKDKSGGLKFRPIIIFSGDVEWKIHTAILEKYRQRQEDKKWSDKNQTTMNQPLH